MSQKERDQLTAEFSILASLKHPNIVGYFHREHLKHTQELYMYMEYCGGGDLGTIIKKLTDNNEFAKEDYVWRIFAQLMTALYRCHYGIDPPDPGNDFRRAKDSRQLVNGKASQMILHRDLKPENIFLGEDHAVKLGDFGLSKLMQSHDFASTYVGTPFYMSPEICAAEKYTLQSDIWSVGCIMYELCTREPPFNANSHLQLVQKIRKGHVKPIPEHYSTELSGIIMSCLRTNPTLRPDTATIISHPYIWLARKQQEMVSVGKALRLKEDFADQRTKQADERLSALDADRTAMRVELDAQLRREWEVKARLEIDRQVELELDTLRQKFETEVQERISSIMAKHVCKPDTVVSSDPVLQTTFPSHNPHSSVNTAGESEWASTTDLTDLSDLSIHSPSTSISRPFPLKKSKTPFARSKTTFDSPADVQMSEPSPMSISGLALSPRRNVAAQAATSGKNLFIEAARQKARWQPQLAYAEDSDEEKENALAESDDDDFPDLPSPTRPKAPANTDPFKMPTLPINPLPSKARPGMLRQNTIATTNKLTAKPSLFPTAGSMAANHVRAGIAAATQSQIPRSATDYDVRAKATSPSGKRRLSKIPSRNDLRAENAGSTSPLRRAATTTGSSGGSMKLQSKLATAKIDTNLHVVAGRTRVELAQARAGGRPMSADFGGNPMAIRREKDLPPVPIWDEDELGPDMPSPFLKRDVKTLPARGWR